MSFFIIKGHCASLQHYRCRSFLNVTLGMEEDFYHRFVGVYALFLFVGNNITLGSFTTLDTRDGAITLLWIFIFVIFLDLDYNVVVIVHYVSCNRVHVISYVGEINQALTYMHVATFSQPCKSIPSGANITLEAIYSPKSCSRISLSVMHNCQLRDLDMKKPTLGVQGVGLVHVTCIIVHHCAFKHARLVNFWNMLVRLKIWEIWKSIYLWLTKTTSNRIKAKFGSPHFFSSGNTFKMIIDTIFVKKIIGWHKACMIKLPTF